MKNAPRFKSFYHFTDAANLETIRRYGLLSKSFMKSVGLPFLPSGSPESHRSDDISGVSTCISLSFTDDHPMMHVAKREGRVSKPFVLEVDSDILAFDSVFFCPIMANTKGAEFYTIDAALEQGYVDFDILYKYNNWRDDDCAKRLYRASKYELLVPNCVPPYFLRNI